MKIIIIGSGKVGYTLAAQLSKEKHDIIIIDKNLDALQKAQEELDVMTVLGTGTDPQAQKSAGVDTGDIMIAVTPTDEVNLLCCLLARNLGCKHTIARVRNPVNESMTSLLRSDLRLSMSINPERAAAREIFRLLQMPSFVKRDTFGKGRIELLEYKLPEQSVFCGQSISRVNSIANTSLLICVVDRDGEITIPRGDYTLQSGDRIIIAIATQNIPVLLKNAGIATTKIHSVMIIGGSRTAAYLTGLLLHSRVSVKIIEQDADRCAELSAEFPSAIVINANGTEQNILLEEGLERMDAVVTLTGLDEQNLIISMYSDYLGVPKTITKMNRMEYAMVLKEKGMDTFVSPKLITANEIIRYVRAMDSSGDRAMLSLHRIDDSKAEAAEFAVTESTKNLGIPLSALKIRRGVLVASIARNGQVIIPNGNDMLQLNDAVIIVVKTDTPIIALNDIFAEE